MAEANNTVGLKAYSAILSKVGAKRYLSASCSPIKESDGSIVGFVTVFRDITYIRESENKFRRLFHNAADAIIVHKINKDGRLGKVIEINDLLDFSKVEAGKMTIENIDFNIRELIGDIIKAHMPQSAE